MNSLRVLQVVTRMVRGGAQQVVLDLLERLPRGSYRQALVCGAGSADEAALLPRAERAAEEVIRVPGLVREVRPRADAAAVARLGALFRRRRPDVVHAHTYKAGVTASVAARLAGVPAVVFTPHGHIFARGSRIPGVPEGGRRLAALLWITRAAQCFAHRVTALSTADLEGQLALGLAPRSKYCVVRNGIDVDRFAAPPRRDLSGGPVIGAVGRFTEEKGHTHLVEAFARARVALPGARLVLVGYGELEADLRQRATSLGLDGAVRFAGERDSAEMLPGFDLFVQPSLYESQGLAILEAMAAGRPVVASDVGGVRDVVQEGETGLLVPPADPAALAGAIVRLARSPDLASSMADRARARVRELFTLDRMVEAYARLYRQILGR